MSVHRLIIVGIFIAGLAGCALRPLPEDVTGDTTVEIVRKIRCETRDAIKRENYPPATVIAYDFRFHITENNDSGFSINLLDPFTKGDRKGALNADFDRERHNQRAFRIKENFGSLLQEVSDQHCEGSSTGKNWAYPITGSIGLAETIETFFKLMDASLSGKDKLPPTLTDTIRFQTVLSGSMTPKIEFSPLGSRLQLADASFTALSKRVDIHEVIVSISLDSVGPVRAPQSARRTPSVRAATPASRAVDRAIDQQRLLNILEPLGDLEELDLD